MSAWNGKAKLVGVIGDPIAHSLSPMIHEYWIRQHKLNAAYVPLHISADDFEHYLPMLVNTGFVGFNITLPHKEQAFQMMDSVDMTAKICGSVNTIIAKKTGELHGMNTDVFGFSQLQKPFVKKSDISKPYIVIGAGGAARAVILSATDAGYTHIIIANRTIEKAQAICDSFAKKFVDVKYDAISLHQLEDAASDASFLVNCLSLHALEAIDMDALIHITPQNAVCIDISYGKSGTPFTLAAARHGRQYTDGALMLLHQAAPAFEQWFKMMPEVNDTLIDMMRRAAL